MPLFVEGDLWTALDRVDLLLVSSNATLTQTGALVMGCGAARQMARRFPGIDGQFGAQLAARGGEHCVAMRRPAQQAVPYWVICRRLPETRCALGLFQVKFHFRQPALPGLIQGSAEALALWLALAEEQEQRPLTVAMNYPGIGAGGLAEAAVRPLLVNLPARVAIYRRAARGGPSPGGLFPC